MEKDGSNLMKFKLNLKKVSRACDSNVVSLDSYLNLGAFEKDSRLHILMEFCEGGDLSERIKKQSGVLFEESVITDWFAQISLAVRYCHEKKILHRDIKTSNIFLHRHGKQVI